MPRHRNQELLRAIGRRVAEARQARGWTQATLAEAVGIEPISISRQETGQRALSLSTLAVMAGALEVSLGDLLDVDRPIPPSGKLPGEAELLHVYRGLDEEQRDLLLRLAKDVAK